MNSGELRFIEHSIHSEKGATKHRDHAGYETSKGGRKGSLGAVNVDFAAIGA